MSTVQVFTGIGLLAVVMLVAAIIMFVVATSMVGNNNKFNSAYFKKRCDAEQMRRKCDALIRELTLIRDSAAEIAKD